MSRRLVETLESALAELAQEVSKDASVLVQFAAGDWEKIRAALKEARAALDAPTPVAAPVAEQVAVVAAPTPEPVAEPVEDDNVSRETLKGQTS